MSPEPMAYTTANGSIWVFPDGPNHAGQYIGCTDADDISESEGAIDLIRCFDANGKYKIVGEKLGPPDPVTTTLTQLTFKTRTWLERNRGKYGLTFLQRDGGRADAFTNWQRALILVDVWNNKKTFGAPVKREADEVVTRGFDISATPPVIECVEVEGDRITSAEARAFTDIAMLPTATGILPVKYGVAVANSSAIAKSNVYITADGGVTWTVTATLPFSAAVVGKISACAILDMGGDNRRILVSVMGAAGAIQGQTAYSDDDGATWTLVSIGGAAAGHGATHSGGIFALDQHHIWLAGVSGYIYFSDDAGETWTAQDAGVVTAGAYTQVKFTSDGVYGFAIAAAGIVALTQTGGANWLATGAPVTGTPNLESLAVRDEDTLWVGADGGLLFYSEDAGDTWSARTGWTGSGAGHIHSMGFANNYCGFMLVDNAVVNGKILRTIDGGYTWQVLTADTNSGLTAIWVGDENYANYVGLVNAATGFVGVLSE